MLAMAIRMPTRIAVRIVAAVLLALWIACLCSREGRGEKHSADYDNYTQHGRHGWRRHRSVTYFFVATAPSPGAEVINQRGDAELINRERRRGRSHQQGDDDLGFIRRRAASCNCGLPRGVRAARRSASPVQHLLPQWPSRKIAAPALRAARHQRGEVSPPCMDASRHRVPRCSLRAMPHISRLQLDFFLCTPEGARNGLKSASAATAGTLQSVEAQCAGPAEIPWIKTPSLHSPAVLPVLKWTECICPQVRHLTDI